MKLPHLFVPTESAEMCLNMNKTTENQILGKQKSKSEQLILK